MILTLLVFAASIMVLVGVHEGGHFLTAKAFGVYVKEFAIGFGPRLLQRRGRETVYTLRLIPFGGYVRMAGEDQLETEDDIPEDRVLYNKPPYARALISLAGPATNLALAFVLTLVVIWATPFPLMQVADVIDGAPAAAVLQFGDRILEIDGHRIFTYDQITERINAADGDPLDILLERDGESVHVSVQADYEEAESRYVIGAYFSNAALTNEIDSVASPSSLDVLGMRPGDRIVAVGGAPTDTLVSIELAANDILPAPEITFTLERDGERFDVAVPSAGQTVYEVLDPLTFAHWGIVNQRAGFGQGIALAARQFVGYIRALAELVHSVIAGQTDASDAFQGPIGVAQLLGESARIGASFFFQLLAFLSLNFGLINLVPFPALDGSRAVFAVYEWVRGKPIPPQREGIIHAIGFLILIGLMILITYQDIARLFR